jgi:hypothetical protein
MHLLHLYFKNARQNNTGELCLKRSEGHVAKWHLLLAGKAGLELLRLVATACGGVGLFPNLPFSLQLLCGDADSRLQIETVLALYPLVASQTQNRGLWASGICIDQGGVLRCLARGEYCFTSSSIPRHRAKTGIGNSWLPLLGYGSEPIHHEGTDDFDFTDPFFRLTRFHSLFLDQAPLTDPVAFLAMIHYRGVRCKRLGPMQLLERFGSLFKEYLSIPAERWKGKSCDFREQWQDLAPWQQQAALPALDAARHLLCAYQNHTKPLDLPCLILFDRPDRFCPGELFPRWARFMDRLLPNSQFLVTLPDSVSRLFPNELLVKTFVLPVEQERVKPPQSAPRGSILLIDVDSSLPNLALMKVSRHFKEQGRHVILLRHEAFMKGVEAVYASGIFSRPVTESRIQRLRNYYGDALVVGGSAVDLEKRLPEEIENLPADYSLYPELGDRAIGFLTRGCPFSCPFCIVPLKEGPPRQVADLNKLLANGQRKLLLLDDNILAHPSAGDFLEEMASRELMVNFTQTLDLRLLDQEKVQLLKRIHCSNLRFTRRVTHFSLNDSRSLDEVRCKYEMFGFTRGENVEFICMYGFNTTLAEDVKRFRFLRSLPGAYVFVQQYMPIPGGPFPELTHFFDSDADELIDELTRIVFTQNMKSMENYYRWVSKRYVQTFRKIHQGLVDSIFRYNNRQRKGVYLANMGELCGRKDCDGRCPG